MNTLLLRVSLVTCLTACSTPGVQAGSSCVAEFSDKPCKLLTAQLIKKNYPGVSDKAKQKELLQIQSCSYTWKSNGRTQIIDFAGKQMSVPLKNTIAIKWIRKGSNTEAALRGFNNSYRTMSVAEKADAAAAIQKELDKKSSDMSSKQKNIASAMAEGLGGNIAFQTVKDVGTTAAWGGAGSQASLKVLDRDSEFEIVVNISDDESENLAVASDIANGVIATCK